MHGSLNVGVDGRVVLHKPDVAVFMLPGSWLEQLVRLAAHVEGDGACI